MAIRIHTRYLKLGMYVAELDRPWLGTPFLLQGFLIESDREIAQLQQCCKEVVIDPDRSLEGVCNGLGMPDEVAPAAADDFLAIARRLRQLHEPGRRLGGVPPVDPITRLSDLEAELLYSAPIIDDVHRALESIQSAIDGNTGFDLERVAGLVDEMAAGVQRNPDAMLWLTRLRRTDQYSYDHAVDVSVHLMVFGRFLGIDGDLVSEVGFAGLMQDVGKLQLDPELLAKPTTLTEAEYDAVKAHVASSLALLTGKKGVSGTVIDIVGAHHERLDGSGYPRSIGGADLKLQQEMAGLVDTYCAMTRKRVYSAAISSQRALEALIKMRGTKFRETLVDQYIQCVGLYPIGSLVELNSGEVAVVIQQYQVKRLRPRVLVLLAEDKSVERRPRSLDLILDPLTPTGEVYRIRQALPPDAYGIRPSDFYLD